MGHDAYHKAWVASITRSSIVLKAMIGDAPVTKGSARASVGEIVRATKRAVMDAASAELTPQYERFEGLDEGVAKRDPGAWPLRMREVAEALAARGFERRAVERMGDDFVQFVRESAYGCDRVLVERTGEWAWRNQDGTVAGSDLRELQNIIQQEI